MQSTEAPPTAPCPLPFFAWAIPPECQWRDLATRDPHPPVALYVLRALVPPATEARA